MEPHAGSGCKRTSRPTDRWPDPSRLADDLAAAVLALGLGLSRRFAQAARLVRGGQRLLLFLERLGLRVKRLQSLLGRALLDRLLGLGGRRPAGIQALSLGRDGAFGAFLTLLLGLVALSPRPLTSLLAPALRLGLALCQALVCLLGRARGLLT